MKMPEEEAKALRECLSILAPLHHAHERQTMALQIERRIAGQESALLALSFKQLGPLFYPTDTHMAQEVAQKMQDAFNSGELASSLKTYANGVFISDLIAWPDCPPVPADSPLRYWLTKAMPVSANTGTGGASDDPSVKVPTGNQSPKTTAYEAEVCRQMTAEWDSRSPGTDPNKQDLHQLVYRKMLPGDIKPPRAIHSIATVAQAAKKWSKAAVVAAQSLPVKPPENLPSKAPVQAGATRHPFKGDR